MEFLRRLIFVLRPSQASKDHRKWAIAERDRAFAGLALGSMESRYYNAGRLSFLFLHVYKNSNRKLYEERIGAIGDAGELVRHTTEMDRGYADMRDEWTASYNAAHARGTGSPNS